MFAKPAPPLFLVLLFSSLCHVCANGEETTFASYADASTEAPTFGGSASIVLEGANTTRSVDVYHLELLNDVPPYTYGLYQGCVPRENVSCPAAPELSRLTFESARFAVYSVSCKGRLGNLCVCAEDGECFNEKETIYRVGLFSKCDRKGCHFYLTFINGNMQGDRGTLVSVCKDEFGSDSPFVKAAFVSCYGCAKIRGAKCT